MTKRIRWWLWDTYSHFNIHNLQLHSGMNFSIPLLSWIPSIRNWASCFLCYWWMTLPTVSYPLQSTVILCRGSLPLKVRSFLTKDGIFFTMHSLTQNHNYKTWSPDLNPFSMERQINFMLISRSNMPNNEWWKSSSFSICLFWNELVTMQMISMAADQGDCYTLWNLV